MIDSTVSIRVLPDAPAWRHWMTLRAALQTIALAISRMPLHLNSIYFI
jgi:hypothetical protein